MESKKILFSFPIFVILVFALLFSFGWLFLSILNSSFIQGWVYEVEDKGAGLGTLSFFQNIQPFLTEIFLFLAIFVVLVFISRWILKKYKFLS